MTIQKEQNPLLNDLVRWGLPRAEAEVYLYLLQRPDPMGGTKIAGGAGLHRQQVYKALESLIELRLVEPVQIEKYKKYKARPPFEIEKITRKKSVQASDLAHELNKISAIHAEQDFEVLQGAKQIQQYELDYVYESKEGAEEFIIGGEAKWFREMMGDYLEEYLQEKRDKKMVIRYIGSETEREMYEKTFGAFPNQESRFIAGMPQGITHLAIRPDTVVFFSYLTPPIEYVLKSEAVARDYRQFFQTLWNMAASTTAPSR